MKRLSEAFERALADPGAVDTAMEAAQAFLTAHEGHPVATAYLGSLTGMKAGAASLPWVKLAHANAAAALLDAAHERRFEALPAADGDAYPAALAILLLRGVAFASFPAFLGRGAAALASLEEAARHPDFAGIPEAHRTLALAHLSRLRGGSAAPERAAPEDRRVSNHK